MADQRGSDGKIENTALLLEYFSPERYQQHQDLTFDQAKIAVSTLAKFHAFHWKDTDAAANKDLFERGGWWRAELRPSVKFDTIAESFKSLCVNFVEEFKDVDTVESYALMQKLQDHVVDIGRCKERVIHTREGKISPIMMPPPFDSHTGERIRRKGDRTLMHGDCKTSNLFFTLSDDNVALIDFQWTGAASSGVGDVAYLLWSGMQMQ